MFNTNEKTELLTAEILTYKIGSMGEILAVKTIWGKWYDSDNVTLNYSKVHSQLSNL